MKSIKTLAYMGAIALLSVGLMSCHKDEPENNFTDANGNYKGETVKTQFMISISEGVASSNKRFMQGADVQAGGTLDEFLANGMANISLIPYADFGDGKDRIGKLIVLDPIKAKGTESGKINAKQSIYYSDIAIPLGTKNFLFYATSGNVALDDQTRHQYGAVTVNNLNDSKEKEEISFDLVPIYSGGIPTIATNLANYLTSIANVEGWSTHSNNAVKQLNIDFKKMTAGSSASVLALVTDLYNTLKLFQETQASADAVVDKVLEAIEAGATATGAERPYSLTLSSELSEYPASINLPDGAAKVEWTTDDKFAVVENNITVGDLKTQSLNSYVYPASLQYYAQSTIKTSKESRAYLYDGTKNWDDILGQYEQGAEVFNTTRSVALENKINYGVGQLRTTVKLGQNVETLIDEDDHVVVNVSDVEAIPSWTALLIGGQKSVGYDFTLNTISGNNDAYYTIYDNALPFEQEKTAIELSKEATAPNYTLVFSTIDNPGNDDKVYIAIELINNAVTFTGANGQIIPAGAKFYLVGELDFAKAKDQNKGPVYHNIFYKDYYTTLNLTINTESLKKAYNNIPDLRSEELELGFSVDLEWQEGLTFNVEL